VDRFILSPVPLESGPDENEHRLAVPDCLLLRRVIAHELRTDALARLQWAVPDLIAIGNGCVLRRAPTETDLEQLRLLAGWYGFPFDATVRSDKQFTNERRFRTAHRRGRWIP